MIEKAYSFIHRKLLSDSEHSSSLAEAVPFRQVVSLIGFLLVWELLAFLLPLGVPSPLDTLAEVYQILVADTNSFVGTISISLFRILAGFLVSLLLGTGIGILMGFSTKNEEYLYQVVLITMMIPSLSWAMITLVAFGLNEIAIVSAIFLTTTPFISVTIWEGVKDAETELIEMAAMFNFTEYNRIRHVILPQLSPYIFSAARYGLGISWKIAVVVELLGANSGVGYELNQAFSLFNLEGVFAWTAIVIFIMLVIEYGLLRTTENFVLSWRTRGHYQWR